MHIRGPRRNVVVGEYMSRRLKGYAQAQHMRRWADRKGCSYAEDDGFDRSTPFTLASRSDEWLAWLSERAYSPRSVKASKWTMRYFLRWAEERDLKRPEQITKPILESYQRWLYQYRRSNGQPLVVMTQRGWMGAVQRFFAWLCKMNHLAANPAADLEMPRKQPRSLPKALSVEDINAVLAVPDLSDALGVRDRTMLELFYATGIRRAELVNLDLEDVDVTRSRLTVRKGKGGKDRVTPLGEQACAWLDKYLSHVRPKLHVSLVEHAFFLTGYGERFSPGYVGNLVRQIIEKANIGRSGSCHIFRHSCATHMLEGGADIRYIQQLLGHANLDTTSIYTELSIIQLQEVYLRTHPHARIAQAAPAATETPPADE